MPCFSTTTSISAPPARVWAVLSQVAPWQGWTPTGESVTPVDGQRGDAPAVGRSYNAGVLCVIGRGCGCTGGTPHSHSIIDIRHFWLQINYLHSIDC